MTEVRTSIVVDINTSQASAHLRALQQQINAFQMSLNKGNIAQGSMARDNAQRLMDMANATRFFTAETIKMRTAASQLDNTLSRGRGTMGQWLGARFVKDGAAAAQVMSLAQRRASALQTQFVATGAAANGFKEAIAIRPLAAFNSQAAITNQRLAIQRAMFTQATTSMINFGKNTQWAGRQLMVGFTVPLVMFGALAGKTFRELEKEIINFRKVYGDSMTPPAELEKNLQAMRGLANEFTKYGIAAKDTMALAAQAAAAGAKNADLMDATTEATRLATLGQMEQQEALKTTISLQNAFGLSGEKLTKSINFLNMVENQTVVTLQDLAEAIPRVAPVIKGLGGSVEDMAAMLAAMQEGGVSAAQGANALKSGLASLINPTNKAVEKLAELGINMRGIIDANRGDLMGTVKGFAEALSQLDSFGQQQALEKVFGKYQYARLGALFNNINKAGTQASRVMEIASLSTEQLAQTANRELNTISDNVATKFTAAIEKFKLAIAPIGELFTKMATPIINFFTMILDKFNSLPDFAKNFIGLGAVITGVVIPAGTMFLGLLMNLTGTLLKFGHIMGVTFKGLLTGGVKGALQAVNQSLQYMSLAEMEAAEAGAQLAGASTAVNAALAKQAAAAGAAVTPVVELATAYGILATRMAEASAMANATSPMYRPGMAMEAARGITLRRIRRNFGGSIPGTGNSDTVPAMLTPGEFVVNKEATAKHLPLLHEINQSKGGPTVKGGVQYAQNGNEIIDFAANGLNPDGSRISQARAAQSRGYSGGVKRLTLASMEEIDYINTRIAEAIMRLGYTGPEDLSFITRLPLGTAAFSDSLNQQFRLGTANPQSVIAELRRTGFDNPLTPLFESRRVGSYIAQGNFGPDVFKAVVQGLMDEVGSLRGPIHDSDLYPAAQKAFAGAGASDLYEWLRIEENSGAMRTGLSERVKKYVLGALNSRSYDPLFEMAFGEGFRPDLATGRYRERPITMPDGSLLGLTTGLTKDIPGLYSYQSSAIASIKGTHKSHFQEPGAWFKRMFVRGRPVFANSGGFLGMPESSSEVARALARRKALKKANQEMSTGRFAGMPITTGSLVEAIGGHSSTFPGVNGVYDIDGNKFVVKFHDTADSAMIEARGSYLARSLHGLVSPEQTLVKMRHPVTGDLMPGVLSPYNAAFARSTAMIPSDAFASQLMASIIGRNRDLQPDNMFGRMYPDVGAAGFGVDANGNPSAMTGRSFGIPAVSASEQLGINLLMTKGGAKKWFAEHTAQLAASMTDSQYASTMMKEIARTRAVLAQSISGLPYSDDAMKKVYMDRIAQDLDELERVNWASVRQHHAGITPSVPKTPTAAALAKAEAERINKMRRRGMGRFGRFGIPFLSGGGLLGNFDLDDSGPLNIYRNRSGAGQGAFSTFFGRMQPPTIGHGMMMDQTILHALNTGSDFGIYTPLFGGKDARSPLTLEQRLAAIYEAKGIRASGAGNAYTIFDALKAGGYSNVARLMGATDMASDSFGKAALSRGMSSSLIGIDRGILPVSGTAVRNAAMSGDINAAMAAGMLGGSPRTRAGILKSIMLHRNAGGLIPNLLRRWIGTESNQMAVLRGEIIADKTLSGLMRKAHKPVGSDIELDRGTWIPKSSLPGIGDEVAFGDMTSFVQRGTSDASRHILNSSTYQKMVNAINYNRPLSEVQKTIKNRAALLKSFRDGTFSYDDYKKLSWREKHPSDLKEERFGRFSVDGIMFNSLEEAMEKGLANSIRMNQSAVKEIKGAKRWLSENAPVVFKTVAPKGSPLINVSSYLPQEERLFRGLPEPGNEYIGSGKAKVARVEEAKGYTIIHLEAPEWHMPRFNTGGLYDPNTHGRTVPGVGNTDTVPAMLTPGEFVINKASTQKHLPLLRAINSGNIPGFNNGGEIRIEGDSVSGYTPYDKDGNALGRFSTYYEAEDAARAANRPARGNSRLARGMRGAGGVGMALTMASMMPMMMEPGSSFLGMDASTASMGMMGAGTLASFAPMLAPAMAGPQGLVIAGVAAAAAATTAALVMWRKGIDNAANETAKFGANIGGTANALNTMAKVLGTETPAQAMTRMQMGFTSEDQAMLEGPLAEIFSSESGKAFIEDLKNATSAERFKKLSDYLKSAIASGMMDNQMAQSFAKATGLLLNDAALGASASSAVRNQSTGTAAYRAIANSREAAVNAAGIPESVLAGDQEIDVSVAGKAIGAAVQVIQDYSNVIAIARKQYAEGTITFDQYNAAVDEARAAQQKYTEVITSAVARSTEQGGARQALDNQLLATGMTQEQVDALTHATDIGISRILGSASAYEQEYKARMGYVGDGTAMVTKEEAAQQAEASRVQDLARQVDTDGLNEKIKASVLAGEMSAESAVAFADAVMYSEKSLLALAQGASVAEVAFRMSADSLNGVNKSQYASFGSALIAAGVDPAAFQSYLGGQSEAGRQDALNNLQQLSTVTYGNRMQKQVVDERIASEFLNNYGMLSSSIGQDSANRLQSSNAYAEAIKTEGSGTRISKAFASAANRGVSSQVIDYVISVNGSKSDANVLTSEINAMATATENIMSLPDEVIKGLKIDTNDPEDLKKFGLMTETIKDNWNIVQNLNPNVDMVAQMQFLLIDSEGNPLPAEDVAANVKALNDAINALDSGKAEVEKTAAIKLLTTTNGSTMSLSEATAAYDELVAKYGEKNLVKLPTDVYQKVIALQVEIEGLDEAIVATRAAMAALGKTGGNKAQAEALERQLAALIAARKTARITQRSTVDAGLSSSGNNNGGGGGGGGGTKSLIQQMKENFKNLRKVFDSLASMGIGQTEKIKGFIAGPFAPEFIEYLKAQGEEGVKILKQGGAKFKAAYEAFKDEQSQIAKNYLQTLPANMRAARDVDAGTNRIAQTLIGMGVAPDAAMEIAQGIPDTDRRAYEIAMRKPPKKRTKADREIINQYSSDSLRNIANEGVATQRQSNAFARESQLDARYNQAVTESWLRGLGYTEDMVAELSQLPGIWGMSNEEVANYAAQIRAIMAMNPQQLEQQRLENLMQINDIQQQIAEIEILKPLQDALDAEQKRADALSRQIELKQREISKIDESIAKVEEEKEKINEKYDLQIDALEKVENVNRRIADQQRAQLDIASALSRGDVAAAAEAMLNAQRQQAEGRLQDSRDAIEQARQNDLKAKDDIINKYKEQRKVIEDQIKVLQEEQLVISDSIYNMQLNINTVTDDLAKKYNNATYQLSLLRAELEEVLRIQQSIAAAAGRSGSTTSAPTQADIEAVTDPGGSWVMFNGQRIWIPNIDAEWARSNAGYSFGGLVRGIGNSDIVRARLTPGEFVVRKPAAKAWGPLLQAINSNVFPQMNLSGPGIKGAAQTAPIQYTYGDINVQVSGTDLDPDAVANAIMYKIQRTHDRQIKGVRVSGN